MSPPIVNRGNGIAGGGGVVIKLHQMKTFLVSSYMLPLPASLALQLHLLNLLGFSPLEVLSIGTMGKRWWRCYQIASDGGDYLSITMISLSEYYNDEATIARLHLALCNSH